jgi:hypothetical protein
MADSCERDDESSSPGRGAELLTQELSASHDEIYWMELVKIPFILSDLNCKDRGESITVLKRRIMKVYWEVEVLVHSFLIYIKITRHLCTPAA